MNGTLSAGNIALAILGAAQNTDAVIVANKVLVANEYTKQVSGRDFSDPLFGTDQDTKFHYSGEEAAAAARKLLSGVSDDPATLPDVEDLRKQLEDQAGGNDDVIVSPPAPVTPPPIPPAV